jgi:hypothetical protein
MMLMTKKSEQAKKAVKPVSTPVQPPTVSANDANASLSSDNWPESFKYVSLYNNASQKAMYDLSGSFLFFIGNMLQMRSSVVQRVRKMHYRHNSQNSSKMPRGEVLYIPWTGLRWTCHRK